MGTKEKKRFLEVGWLAEGASDPACPAPQALDLPALENASGKAVTACPAVLQHEARIYEIRCPQAFQVSASLKDTVLHTQVAGDGTLAGESLSVLPASRWRHPSRPMIQIATPYRFVSDDYCFLSLIPPLYDFKADRWPGLAVAERFRLDLWPRRISFTFEWHELDRPLILKQGEPWLYARFEGREPTRSTQLFRAQRTERLEERLRASDALLDQFDQCFSSLRSTTEDTGALVQREKP